MLNEELFNAIARLIIEKDLGKGALPQVKLEYFYQDEKIKLRYKPFDFNGSTISLSRKIDGPSGYHRTISLIYGRTENSKHCSQLLVDMYNLLTTT